MEVRRGEQELGLASGKLTSGDAYDRGCERSWPFSWLSIRTVSCAANLGGFRGEGQSTYGSQMKQNVIDGSALVQ